MKVRENTKKFMKNGKRFFNKLLVYCIPTSEKKKIFPTVIKT